MAERATQAMILSEPDMPRTTRQRREPAARAALRPTGKLEELRAEAANCRACPLWRDATQTVFGEGSADAEIMFVGEQPGDKEDLAGKPFVGPAGQVFDRALKDAGITRDRTYVTNAVKHFKFVPRGKIRIHQKPSTPEIRACRPWYEAELAAVKPTLVVALGATAAQSVLGKITTIGKVRGKVLDANDGVKALVTVHPSYLLRLPDEDAKEREYERFVDDLKIASATLRKAARAA
jgi:DNA polymerase